MEPKQKRHINLFDLLIIAFLILVAFVVFKFFTGKATAQTQGEKTVYFTVEIRTVNADHAKNFPVGETVRDAVNDTYYGEIAEVKSVPLKVSTENMVDGTFILANVSNYYNTEVKIKCKGTQTDTATIVSGTKVCVGKNMYIKGKGFAGEGYIVDLIVE